MLTTSCISCCHFPKQAILCSHLLHRGPPTYPRLQVPVVNHGPEVDHPRGPSSAVASGCVSHSAYAIRLTSSPHGGIFSSQEEEWKQYSKIF